MTKITLRNYAGSLVLPLGGVTLRPEVATEIPNWDVMKNHNVVKQWLNAGILDDGSSAAKKSVAQSSSTDGAGSAPAGGASPAGATPTAEELAALSGNGGGSGGANDEGDANAELTDAEKARAKELGLTITWNTKPATARERIAAAEAKAAESK